MSTATTGLLKNLKTRRRQKSLRVVHDDVWLFYLKSVGDFESRVKLIRQVLLAFTGGKWTAAAKKFSDHTWRRIIVVVAVVVVAVVVVVVAREKTY